MRLIPDYRSLGFTPMDLKVVIPGPGDQPAPAQPAAQEAQPVFWPIQSTQYMYPVNVPAAPETPVPSNGIDTKTLLIGGAIVLTGVLAVVLLKK